MITSLRTGGAERLVSELLPRFRSAGIDVELAIFDSTPSAFLSNLELEGIRIHKFGIGYKSMYNPLHILRLRRLLGNFDIVHTHNSSCQLFTAIASRLTTRKTVLVTTEHNTSNRRRQWSWYRIIDNFMYGCYEKIISCSGETEKGLINAFSRYRPKFTTIPNGINLNNYSSSGQSFKTSNKVIAMIAAFRPQKDHLTAIKALAMLPDDYHLYFAGEGVLLDAVKETVDSANLSHRVHFLGNVDNIAGLFKSADCAILCTHYEGLPLSAVEAMASGTPLIASDVPGVTELVSSAGILVPPSDAEALANAIRNVLTDQSLQASLVKSGLERAAQFSIESTVNQYTTLYTNLIFK